MNNLSWFLYLADVLPTFSRALCFISAMSVFLGILCLVPVIAESSNISHAFLIIKSMIAFIVMMAILWFVSFLVPSRQTIYMIAGSEAGEMVVTSETGQQILGDIKEVIRTQLNELKK